MGDLVNEILDNANLVSGVSLKKGSNGSELLLDLPDGHGRQVYYPLFPGITLAFMWINSRVWPESENNAGIKPLRINYCLNGRGEMLLDDNTYVYLQENDFSVSLQAAQKEFVFPTGHYQGIALFFDDSLSDDSGRLVLDAFGIDVSFLEKIYCKQKTYIGEANEDVNTVFRKLWGLSECPSFFHMKLYVIELLYVLLEKKNAANKTCTFYTGIQVEIAKKAEEILTADLSKHYPIRILAEQFSISDTSLKNYFRGVYGQNVSSYLREVRMYAAAKMLTETDKAISEISHEVGYTNQGKFAAIFKQYFSMAPLEYRRSRRLEHFSSPKTANYVYF